MRLIFSFPQDYQENDFLKGLPKEVTLMPKFERHNGMLLFDFDLEEDAAAAIRFSKIYEGKVIT